MKVSAREIANVTKLTKRSIQRRRKKDGLPCTTTKGLGGTRRLYNIVDLPPSEQRAFANCLTEAFSPDEIKRLIASDRRVSKQKFNKVLPSVLVESEPGHWLSSHSFAQTSPALLPGVMQNRPAAQAALLKLALDYAAYCDIGKIKGLDQFSKIYNKHEFGLQPCVYERYKRVSRITLLRWERSANGSDNTMIGYFPDPTSFEHLLHNTLTQIGIFTTAQNIQYLTTKLVAVRFDVSALKPLTKPHTYRS
ncbi:MAG: hypothetical protein ACI8WB_002330 [Phenylobacterium sp.]|jgi:hypothetical protein